MTNDKLEEEIDKMYDEMFQKQTEMEELGLINYGDRSYYLQHPEEYEKDSKICELESEVIRLEHKLEITEKALELACEDVDCSSCRFFRKCGTESCINDNRLEKWYLEQAKEIMKSE